jgi:hypothetical protein
MKMLILSLMFCPFVAFAIDEMQGLHEQGEAQFMTVVKDVEVERLIGSEPAFNKCRDENKFEKNDLKKQAKIAAATKCFNAYLSSRPEGDLKKLASNLKLEEYGLTQSKNVNEISSYLSGKMHKALTGVSPTDKDYGKQKWEDKKIVDQKVFIELYKNQLVKNSLFEISRYCFENLRKTTQTTSTDFGSYWKIGELAVKDGPIKDVPVVSMNIADLTDVGDPDGKNIFFDGKMMNVDLKDEKVVYEKLVSGLTSGAEKIEPVLYEAFFPFCRAVIAPLCQIYRDSKPTTPKPGDPVKLTRGASSCLTITKLESIRTTLRNTEKVSKQFLEMEDKGTFALKMLKNPKVFGQDASDASLDELTSVGSADFLKEADNDKLSDLETKCATNVQDPECEEFLKINDGLDKATSTIETEMILKRELETARVKNLNDQSLKDYLKENGHFDLLERMALTGADHLTDDMVKEEIKKFYDAKAAAEIEALKFKVGKRQMNETEAGKIDKVGQIKENITNSKEERVRLAQVVMFNNIITSQLNLSKTTGGKTSKIGSNISGWSKETAGLNGVSGVDQSLFAGIQESADKNGSKTKESIADVSFLDAILGTDTRKEA